MEVLRPATASDFLELALPLLERDEARNQLPLAVARTVAEHPEAYDEPRFWIAIEDGAAVAAALHTPPYGALLADPVSTAGLAAVLAVVAEDDPEVPGIVGMVPHIETAAGTLAAVTGRRPERMLSQGVYAPGGPSGPACPGIGSTGRRRRPGSPPPVDYRLRHRIAARSRPRDRPDRPDARYPA